MNRVLLIAGAFALVGAGEALAADLPPAAPPPAKAPVAYAPPPAYNWSGFYIGGNLGAAWTGGNFSDPAGNTFTGGGTSTTQFVGGGQVGANYEFWGGAVIGVEGDFEWLPNTSNTSNSITDTFGNTDSLTANNRWLTTLTGRLGYAFDRVLVYAKGGGAWVGSSTPTITINGVPFSTTINSNWGWTAGAGVEWAFAGTWSVRAEYDYVGLQSQSFTVPATAPLGIAGDVFTGNNRNIQLFLAGLNFKFGPW
jgi:outer membrane immunogenic protein